MLRQLGTRPRVKATLMAPLLGLALFVGVFVSVSAPVVQAAATSSNLNFQARLLNNLGGIVPDGNYNIDFKIYNADSTTGTVGTCAGACVWEETRTNAGGHGVQVINGYFSVNLGSVTAFGSSINWDQQLWLTMNIGGTSAGAVTWDGEMQNSGHSIALTALPYAFTAGQLAKTSGANRGTLGFNTVANNPAIILPDASGTVCLQTSSSCGFISGSGTAFIQNGNTLGATAVFGTLDGNGINIITNNHVVQSLSSTGAAVFENFSNSAAAFQIQDSSASSYLNVNTSDGYVINNGTADLGNDLQNPGFESSGTTDGTGWYTPSASQVITNSSANAHGGNNELQITGNSNTHAVTTKYYAVHPGDTIYVEAWVKNSAGATGDGGIYIEYSDKDKGNATFTSLDTGLPGTSYVLKSTAQTVAAGKYYVRIAASVKATATAGTFYFDDFYLKRVNQQAPLLISNNSSTAFQVQNSSAVTVLGVDATTGKIFTNIANSGTAVGFTLNTTNTLSTAGAKLLSVQNAGTEEFSVDKDGNLVSAGNLNIGSGKQFQIGGTQIATTNLSDGAQIALKNAANTFSSTNSFQVTNTNGFQVQDAAGAHTYIQADTNGGTLYLGNTQTGSTVQIGNSTGAAVTQTISIGSSNTTAGSASTITIGSTIGGALTLQPGGGIIIAAGALGTADNTSYLCRNSANKLAACITTGTGVAFVNGGNTLGALSGSLASLGTNDANSLQIKTNNVGRATFDQSNNLFLGNADGGGTNVAPNNFNVKGTGSSTAGTAGGDVGLYGGAGASSTTGSAGGNVTINGGAAGGTGNNAGGNITLVAGVNTGSGAAGGVTVKNAANSTTAFQVQTTGSAAVFSVNTSTPTVTVAGGTVFASNTYTSGANSTITQSLVDNNTTISATATAASLTFTVPAPTTATTGRLLYIGNGGSNAFTLNTGGGSYNLAPGSSATLIYIGSAWTIAGIDASTLQLAYTNSTGGVTPEIKLDSTRATLNIQDADSTISADILDVNASNGGGGGLGTVVFGVGNTGATKVHTTGTGSAAAFVVQNANSANFITVDTTSGGNSVSLDSDTGSAGTIKIGNTGGHAQTVSIGLTASSASNSTVNIATNANAGATNLISIGSNGNVANAVTIEAGSSGGINLGNTDVAHTFNIGNGGSTTAQTVNIGSNSSTGAVNIKAGGTGITLNTNGSTAGTVVKSVTSNSTVAFQIQNASANSLFNVDSSGNIITLGSTAQALNGTQGIKIYGANSASSGVDLLTPVDSSANSLFYGANNSRAQFGYNGTNSNASIKAASGVGFELMANGASTATFTASTNGNILFKNYGDSAAAFQVQNQNNRLLLGVDNVNSVINIGNSTDGAQLTLGAAGNVNSVIRKTMVVNGTIAANDLVQIDTANAGQVKQAVANSNNVFGIASSAVGSGASQDIVISGVYQVNANASGGTINVGDVVVSSSTAGQVTKTGTTTASGTVVGLALSTVVSGKVWVYINLGLGGSDNLQTVYNKSTGGSNSTPTIKLSSGVGGINIQDADTTLGTDLLDIRSSNGSGLGTVLFGIGNTGNVTVQNTGGTQLMNINTAADASNLITNGSSEQTPVSGTAKAGTGATPTLSQVGTGTVIPYVGSFSMSVATSSGDATNSGVKWSGTFTNSQAYNFTVYARASGSSFAAFELGNSNNNSTDTSCLTAQTVVTTGWTRFTCSFTYTGTTGTSYVYVKQTDSSNRTYYLDALKLETTSISTPYQESTISLNGVFNQPGTFKNQSDSTTAFQVQSSSGGNILVVDSLNKQLKIYDGAGGSNYAFVSYNSGTGTATFSTTGSTVAVGPGAGAITVTAGSGAAVNITANAASSWKTNTGTLTLQSGSGSSDFLILNAGGSNQIQVSGTSILKFGSTTADPTCVNGAIYYNSTTPQFRGCVNGTWQNLASITPTLQTVYAASTGSTTPEIKVASTQAAVDIQDADGGLNGTGGVIFAVRMQNAGGLGNALLSVNTNGNIVNVGSSSGHSSNQVILVLDNYSNSGADPTGVVGALYYNGTNGKFRCYDGTWRDCMTGFNEISKTSDQAATQSSTAFQNDSTLLFPMAASTNYVFDAWIPIDDSNGTALGKYTFTVPTGAVLNISTTNTATVNTSATTANNFCNITTSATSCALTLSSSVNFIQVRGYVRNGSTAGNLQFQFAQNTSTAASFPVIKSGAVLSWRNAN
jgi:hypothetical protein